MKGFSLLSFFALSTLFAADPVFDGLDNTDLSKQQDESAIYSTPGFNLNLGNDFSDSNRPKGKRIDLAKYTRINANAFYHTDDGFLIAFDAFLPFIGFDRTLAFFDLRFTDFEGSAMEGNFGIGFRHLTMSEKLMWGLYSFYDRKKSLHSNFFSQLTFGFELKTKKIWADANLYIPVGNNAKRDPDFDQIRMEPSSMQFFQNLFFVRGEEKAMPGFDAEVGFLVSKSQEIRVFGGFYYFNTKDAPTIAGPFVRATYRLDSQLNNSLRVFDYITFETGARYDSERKFDAYLGFRLTIPLGGKSVRHDKGMRKYFNDYIRRDVQIITAGNTKKEFQRLDNGSAPVEIMVADTKGLFDTGVLNGDVIAVQGSVTPNGQVDLKDGQFLTGKYYTFNDDMQVELSSGGTLIGAGATSQAFINLTSNNTVRDLTVTLTSFASNSAAVGSLVASPLSGDIVIDNILTNGTFVIISMNATTNPVAPFNLYLMNCNIDSPTTIGKSGLDLQVDGMNATATIKNNSFAFSDTNNAIPISILADSTNLDTGLDIQSIAENIFTFAGGSNNGIFLQAITNSSNHSMLNVRTLSSNTFNLTQPGSNNFGLNVITDSSPGPVTINLGMDGGVNQNMFNFTGSTSSKGFEFNTDVATSQINVYVNEGDLGLSAANGDAEVSAIGPNIKFFPSR